MKIQHKIGEDLESGYEKVKESADKYYFSWRQWVTVGIILVYDS